MHTYNMILINKLTTIIDIKNHSLESGQNAEEGVMDRALLVTVVKNLRVRDN